MPPTVKAGFGLVVFSILIGLPAIFLAAPIEGIEQTSKLQEAAFGSLLGALALVGIWIGLIWVVFAYLGLAVVGISLTVLNPEPFQMMMAQHPIVIGLNLTSQGSLILGLIILLTPSAWQWFAECRAHRRAFRAAQDRHRRGPR